MFHLKKKENILTSQKQSVESNKKINLEKKRPLVNQKKNLECSNWLSLSITCLLKTIEKVWQNVEFFWKVLVMFIESCKKFGQTELIKKSNCLDINGN